MLKAKESVDNMLAANALPQTTKSGSLILKSGNKRHTLLNSQGERTALGSYYEQKTANELPVGGFDPTQAPYRGAGGNTEYIRMRNGEERAVRRYDPAENDYRFTKLGSPAKASILVSKETTSCKSLLK